MSGDQLLWQRSARVHALHGRSRAVPRAELASRTLRKKVL